MPDGAEGEGENLLHAKRNREDCTHTHTHKRCLMSIWRDMRFASAFDCRHVRQEGSNETKSKHYLQSEKLLVFLDGAFLLLPAVPRMIGKVRLN